MQISSRVYLIASGHAGCSITHPNDCNAYAVRCGNRYFVIDAGVGVSTELISDQMKQDGICPEAIEGLLLTHGHLDHSGGAHSLQRGLGMPVFASVETARALEAGDEDAISLALAKRSGVYESNFQFLACPVSRKLNGGETWTLGDCQVTALRTPGHARDMLTYIIESPEGVLAFPGDTVFHDGKVLLSGTWDCDPAAYDASLRALATFNIDGLYPGHGIWSVHDGKRHLRASLGFLDRLLLPPNLF